MKRVIIVIISILLCVSMSGCSAYFDALEDMGNAYQQEMDKLLGGGGDTTESDDKTDNNEETPAPPETTEDTKAEQMSDGYINGTNAKTIESKLQGIKEYNWWDDHSLTQSSINKEWSVSCSNNEYNTYTKSYELHAYDTLEIEYAKFKTYDADYEYLLLCADFFDTKLIDAAAVKQWIQAYDTSSGTVEKTFGDATFTLSYQEYSDGEAYVELAVWACGDINSN